DLNLDGIPDLVVGAYSWDDLNIGTGSDNRGRVYVISGKDGSLLFSRNGDAQAEALGTSVGYAMDMNLDGVPDIMAGAPYWTDSLLTKPLAGRVYVLSGTLLPLTSDAHLLSI